MNSQDARAIVLVEKSKPASDYDMPTEAPIQEFGVDELLDYKPVPPRPVLEMYARYRRRVAGGRFPLQSDYLTDHAAQSGPRWRLLSPFLEHFSQALASFFIASWSSVDHPGVSMSASQMAKKTAGNRCQT